MALENGMDGETRKFVVERLSARDSQVYTLAESTDVKAGLVLATAGLALVQADNMSLSGERWWTVWLLYAACLALLGVVASTICVLYPSRTTVEAPETWETNSDLDILSAAWIQNTKNRIQTNESTVQRKLKFNSWALRLLPIGLALYGLVRLAAGHT